MNKEIIIRKVKKEDASEYLKIVNFVWRSAYKDIFPEEVFIKKEEELKEKVEKFSLKYYNDNKKICYVAEYHGNIIGIMNGQINSNYEYFCEKGYSDLIALYIHPDFQSLGIGTKFKEIFIDWAKKNGSNKFVIGVLKDNIKARIIYEKWGGKLSSHTNLFYKLGIGYDEVFYMYQI